MGRSRSSATAHLPPGITTRNGRYYIEFRDAYGSRRMFAGGTSLEKARAMQVTLGGMPRGRQMVLPPHFPTYLWQRARRNAESKAIPFALTVGDVRALIDATDGRCPMSGIAFDYSKSAARFRPWAPSLDRLTPALGYVAGNCRIVCAYINLAINEFGEDVFLAVARSVLATRRANRTRTPPDRRITGKPSVADWYGD